MAGDPPPDLSGERTRIDEVRRELRRFARADGFVPFDRFMDVCLYSEGVGFYERPESPFGPNGDFYTAAHVHPLFGRTVAERIRAVRRALGGDRPFEIVEVGPGDGTLGSTIVRALSERPEEARGISYRLVERSASLSVRARDRVAAASETAALSVVPEPAVGASGPFEGVVLANEFLDALPARRLRWDGTEWRELGVRLSGGHVEPAETALLRPVAAPGLPAGAEPGVVLEYSPAAEGWIRSVADHLVRGMVLVFDYGLEEPELLSAHPRGTLASVRRHRSTDDPWTEPGASDLSVFVNFTRVRSAARRAGLEEIAFASQAEALGGWGFPEQLRDALRTATSSEEEVRTRLAAKNLLFGFERFRVLELAAPRSAGALRSLRRSAASDSS
ncbi:MAG TPA: SAM-dependent methyltransferase [Thermoplasmata archaeon]|nr:SAM-dependent methyltransferase [Thermoplasmata archaeon]